MSPFRKNPLVNNEVYHVVSRSIAGFKTFNSDRDYSRFVDAIRFYKYKTTYKFSDFAELSAETQNKIYDKLDLDIEEHQIIQIIAYCLMPTHLHLVLKQISNNGISVFVNKLLISYSRYFNILHNRKGPLWESRFKSIMITSDELLLHITRYTHLNPTSAGLVKKPEDWKYSSYNEYLNNIKIKICNFEDILDINPKTYKKFVEDRINYQKEISKIKALLLEDYSG